MNSREKQLAFILVFLMPLLLMADSVLVGLPKREVSGQVFVVTRGGENVKLGLVGIHVISTEQLSALVAKLLAETRNAQVTKELLAKFEEEINEMAVPFPEEMRVPFKQISEVARARKMELSKLLWEFDMRGWLFAALPAAKTQTDADGMFTVEAGESDWLAARAERLAGGSSESYVWLIPLRVVPRKLLVSNDKVLKDEAALVKVLQTFVDYPVAPEAAPNVVSWAKEQRKDAQRLVAESKAKVEEAKTRLGSGREFSAGERLIVGLPVRWIPAGRFMMGSVLTEEDVVSDEAQHDVTVSRGFFLAETECKQSQWKAVMGSNPSTFEGEDRPAEQVSWDEAVEFCRRLTKSHQENGAIPAGWAWRLPTEAEWEYAARAGSTSSRHGELDSIAWYSGNARGEKTHPVKQKAANAWGLHDMIGNVWEWCSDWYDGYPSSPVTDPTGANSGSSRVLRGGSWHDDAGRCRSARRNGELPGNRSSDAGFRPVLSSTR